MPPVQIFWDPQGLDLDSLGTRQYLRCTDGDTPFIAMSVRMLSIDTPEVHYPGTQGPSHYDDKLAQLAAWIQAGQAPVDPDLAAHLQPRLASGTAGSLQEQQGMAAKEAFIQLLQARLARPDGSQRSLFLRTADKPFDDNGRLLAYVAPNYSLGELATLSRRDRATFNLLLVDSGWAASFPIYPSLPRYADLVLLHEAARDAQANGRGAWAEPLMLTGYEYRMCVRLYQATAKAVAGTRLTSEERGGWISRYCVDMLSREIHLPQQYVRVPPANRIFVEPRDVAAAVGRMNLLPAGCA